MSDLTPAARSLGDIAAAIGAELVGDGALKVTAVAHPALAASDDTLALGMDEGSERALEATKAGSAAVAKGRHDILQRFRGGLVVERPRFALAQLLALFDRPPNVAPGVHASAVVDPSASLGDGVAIGPLCYLGPRARIGAGTRLLSHVTVGADAVLGADCLLHAGVRIGERCVLGERVIVQANAVVGSDGFGFVTPEKGSIESARENEGRVLARNTGITRINSIGHVIVGDDCEIGAGTCIDRGTLAATRIGRGTKIDNLVQIAHNCTVGENCLIAGMVGLSGSVSIGNRVVLAGNVGVADRVQIGDDAIIMAKSGVGQHVPAREIWGGAPARPRGEIAATLLHTMRLPRMRRDLEQIKTKLEKLEAGWGSRETGGGE
jgi:UDP-3-O-[3-hydroxymyristoyl] glucosamine N-acyltransferase